MAPKDLIKIIEIKRIHLSFLQAHPDAFACPCGEDDRAALDASINCVGVLEPLMVIRENDSPGSNLLVIDGVGRYNSLDDAGVESAPCLIVECDDVRTFVAHKNAMGRKRSSGSRVLSYVMSNWAEYLKVYEEDAKVSSHWSQGAIADRLKVSRQDVQLAAQLYACVSQSKDEYGADLAAADAERMRQVFNMVLSAALPIRRWKAAFAGMQHGTQPGVAGKAQADYAAVLDRGLDGISNAFKSWPTIQWVDDRQRAMAACKLGAALSHCPECMRAVISQAVLNRWTVAERKALLKELKAQGL